MQSDTEFVYHVAVQKTKCNPIQKMKIRPTKEGEVQSDTQRCLALVSACGSIGLQHILLHSLSIFKKKLRPVPPCLLINKMNRDCHMNSWQDCVLKICDGKRWPRTCDRCTCKNMRSFRCWVQTVKHAVLVRRQGFGSKLCLVVHGSTRNDAGSTTPVVLGKSRGRDSTVLPNVSNANEYSLASEQGSV